MEAVRAALVKLNHDVSTSGPHPIHMDDHPFKPEFWVGAKGLPSDKYEPLVIAWSSHDQTVLQTDPGFLMTYGLVPRSANDGIVCWDDPREPRHNIVTVVAPSVWKYPLGTHAYVSISKDYLQDYLTLRKMAVVQVYWEIRWRKSDPESLKCLNGKESVEIGFDDRRLHIGRAMDDQETVFAQVWGARLLAMPGALPVTAESLDDNGLVWPGIDKPVTSGLAQGLGVMDHVYVDDTVLSAYEGRPGFEILPESGAVSFGTQWSVGFCDRIGRNTIRLEVKKLYEGVPDAVVRHWHKFAVAPIPAGKIQAALREPNIAKRAKTMTYSLVALGDALSKLAKSVGLAISPEEFVCLRRAALDYSGWWKPETVELVARHVPLSLTADAFLDRCMSLEKLVIEGLGEGKLRKLLRAMGVPEKDTEGLRTLKLLDRIICLAQLSASSGLKLPKNGASLWERLSKEGANPAEPIRHLFALHDVRILKAHKASELNQALQKQLKRFGVQPGQEAPGYGQILDKIYDALSAELGAATAKLNAVA